MGGGGGGGVKYENLEKLYGLQADQASRLMRQAEEYTYPQFARLSDEAFGYGSIANQNAMAERAGADAAAATSSAAKNLETNLASMGINPADERYAGNLKEIGIQGAAQQAAAQTGARERTAQQGFAREQDVTSLGMGTPTQATQALSSAANTGANIANLQTQANNAFMQGVSGTVRAGTDIYGLMSRADGGLIHLKHGGLVRRYAQGGFTQVMPAPTPPSSAGSGVNPNFEMARAGLMVAGPKGVKEGWNKAMDVVFGPNTVPPEGINVLAPGAQPIPASSATVVAEPAATSNIVPGTVGAVEGAGAATATEAAMAAAVPEVAVAAAPELAELAMLALVADGGHIYRGMSRYANGGTVTPGSHARRGGEVDGPGGPKDDLIPAMLSDGEFVLPIGTVKKYGLAKLEKMRQEGLQLEKELGIHK